MGRLRQALLMLRSVQFLAVLVTVGLIYSSIRPDVALPTIATAQALSFLQPADEGSKPTISINEPGLPALKKTGQTKGAHTNTPAQPTKPNCQKQPCIALTFDDGPDERYTPKVLDILEDEHVTASFFLIGRNIHGNEKIVQRMVRDGFEVGNHSWNHPDFKKLKASHIREEVLATQAAIVEAGAPLPTLFRPPYGSVDKRVEKVINLQVVLWNEDPEDWNTNNAKKLTKGIVKTAKAGGVVDMHDIHKVTVSALRPAIHKLRDKGFQFVTVSELMDAQKQAQKEDTPFFGLYKP
ncbi:polysaccharide deacetylase family protein [Candidatus Saccharibacteria bacterium]|nr:polysaccharide deacetylase family protein [Candidatus Saccharibacteria bacterium]